MMSEEIVDVLNHNVRNGLDKYQTQDGKWSMDIYRDDEDYTTIQVYATNNHLSKTYHGSMAFELDDEGDVVKYLPTTFNEEA